jgi:hypothetical protein
LRSFGRLFVISAQAGIEECGLKAPQRGQLGADVPQLKALLTPYPSKEMVAWPVSPRVGNVKNNDASLIEPITGAG